MVSENITKGSRMKRWEICLDSRSSIPYDKLEPWVKYDVAVTYRVSVNGHKLFRRMVEGCHYTLVDSSSGLKYRDQHCHIVTWEFWICSPSTAGKGLLYSESSRGEIAHLESPFFLRAIIDASCNYIPTTINVGKITSPNWTSSSQC